MKWKMLGTYLLIVTVCISCFAVLRIVFQEQNYIVILLFVLFVAVVPGVVFVNMFFRYLDKTTLRMIESIKEGKGVDLHGNRFHTEPKELSNLAKEIRKIYTEFQSTNYILRQNNLELNAILESVSEGIVAIDIHSNILIANKTAKDLFNIREDVSGKYFLEAFLDSRLDRVFQNVMSKGNKVSTTIQTKLESPKILKIETTILKVDNFKIGAVMLMQDVTELSKLEQMRSDFAANVSHELKTPLTSISGYVETLLEGDVKDSEITKKFLQIIGIETDRLTRLINDILSLSEIELKKFSRFSNKVNVSSILKETIEIMKSHAKAKNISLIQKFPSNDLWLIGNTDRVKQMAINLIDNAIKYTPSGGTVTLILEDDGEKITFRVKDTGIGIDKEHLPRIFERFYRVDKGRSRSMGGTGLGLAIVKHIVKSMKGYIEVYSEPGSGTEFAAYFPIQPKRFP